MSPLHYQESYTRNLPHIQPEGATLFVTFRLAGSLPASVIEELLAQKEASEKRLATIEDSEQHKQEAYLALRQHFGRWDSRLDSITGRPRWLSNPDIARVLIEALHHRDGSVYHLDCFTVMSNHVHVVFTPLAKEDEIYHALPSIMHSLKRHTARKANRILGRKGQFWHHESYDHYVRDDDELGRIRAYVLNNPVKAGLVEEWQDWPWTYCKAYGDSVER